MSTGRPEGAHDAALLRRILDLAPGIIFVVDGGLVVTYVNQAALDLFGYERDDAIGRNILDFVDVEWNPLAIESIGTALASDGGLRQPMMFRGRTRSGATHILRTTANVQLDDPVVNGLVVSAEVWTEQWLLERAFESVAAAEPVLDTLAMLVEIAASETMSAMASIGVARHAHGFDQVVSDDDLPPELAVPRSDVRADDDVLAAWHDVLTGADADRGRVVDVAELPVPLRSAAVGHGLRSLWLWPAERVASDDAEVWAVAWRTEPRLDAQETRTEMMSRLANLAGLAVRRARADERTAHAATHDSMTGLWNRNAVFDAVADALADTTGSGVGVVYLDLDRFKRVNDEFGHAAGDRVLEEIARRLRQAAPIEGRIGRFGGDEFVYAGPADDLAEVEEIADRLSAGVLEPIDLRSGEVVRVGASTGSAFGRPGTVSADELVEQADAELYRIKHDRTDRRPGIE